MPLIDKFYNNDLFTIQWRVEPEHDDLRLDQFLSTYFKTISREEIKRKINKKECIILNRPESKKPSSRIKSEDLIQVTISKSNHEDEYWRGEKLVLEAPTLIFEDSNALIINKPPYMSTHPTGRHLFNCATVYYEQKLNLKTVHSIHRLDRETSGVLLLAKNPDVANLLTKEFENNKVQKCYFFIAKNNREEEDIEFVAKERMDNPEEGLKKVIVQFYPETSKDGKHAQTNFILLNKNSDFVFGLAFPKTGRTHQIRVHAMAHGLPLVGDKLYLGGYQMFQRFKDGMATDDDFNEMILSRHALHATALKINYAKETNIYFAPLPNDMANFIEQYFNISPSEINAEIKRILKDKF